MAKIFYPLYHGGKLDVQTIAVLKQISKANGAPLTSLTPEQARKDFLEKSWLGTPLKNVKSKNLIIEDSGNKVPIRIYTPEGKPPFPILIFFHGGGFVLGNLDEFDALCTFLANGASCVVVSVDYRLAPEYKHPAAVEDALTAVNWIAKNAGEIGGDETKVAVAGDSAGANLAVISSMLARDKSFPALIYQVLICPWLDLSSTNTDSYKYFGDGLWLSKANIYWYRNHYLENEDQAKSYLVSPMLAEKLNGLPPTLIIAAEYDVLRDEGKIFADRLSAKGIQVQYNCYNGMLHDFVTVPGLFDKAKDAINEICCALKKVFYD
jgi:acetyl esterase